MINAINNNIQPEINEFFISSGDLSKGEIQLANDLTREAKVLAIVAEEEARNGSTAKSLAIEAQDKKAGQNLGAIALWHYQRAVQKYRGAIEWFEQAAKLWPQEKKRKVMKFAAKEMQARAGQAETSVKFLNDFLTQN